MARPIKLLLVTAILLQCVGILDHSLWTPDEPRVAEISREMAASGDYLIPHHAQKPFLEQPPLYYATVAFFYRVFGTSYEGVGRFASVLFALGTLLTVFFATRTLYNEQTAGLATLILASSVRFFDVSHKMLVDNALCFFITIALFACMLAYKERLIHGYKIFWIGITFAFLTKGLIGIAIPGVAVALFILWQGDFHLIKRIWAFPGILLLTIVMGIWAWVLYTRGGPDFLRTFYLYNQLGRFLHGSIYTGGHIRPFYYYLTTIWADGAPWSLLLIPFFIKTRKPDEVMRFLCAWFVGGMVLLSTASTKRGLYLLPLFPAMAVMVAYWMSDMSRRVPEKWERIFLYIMGGLVFLCALAVPLGYCLELGGIWWVAILIFATTAMVFWFAYRYMKGNIPSLIILLWSLLLLLWIPALFPQIDKAKGYKDLFSHMGSIVAHEPVAGYQLTETIEALSPFYGGFYVENIEDRRMFEKMLREGNLVYVIILPTRIDKDLGALLMSRGMLLLKDASPTRKDIELWKIGK